MRSASWVVLLLVAILHTLLLRVTSADVTNNDLLDQDTYRRFVTSDLYAKCIDGSRPSYYIKRGNGSGSNKWIVFFQGGGWCYTVYECYRRAKTALGSTAEDEFYLEKKELQRYLSPVADSNPHMYNWNVAYVRYCDGGSFAGNSIMNYEGKTLYFKGQVNRDETIRSLLTKEGMAHAEEVVLSGASAGALALYLGLDQMAAIIHASNKGIIVRGLADSGFFMQYSSGRIMAQNAYRDDDDDDDDDGGGKSSAPHSHNPAEMFPRAIVAGKLDYATAMRNVFTFMNIAVGANRACFVEKRSKAYNLDSSTIAPPERVYSGFVEVDTLQLDDDMTAGRLEHSPESECIFAAHLAPALHTPLFALQPMYDPWQILYELTPDYKTNEVNEYGRKVEHKLLEALLYSSGSSSSGTAARIGGGAGTSGAVNPGHGAFLDSCAHHTRSCFGERKFPPSDAWTEEIFDSIHHMNVADAFATWLAQSESTTSSGATTFTATATATSSASGNPLLLYVQNEDFPCAQCCSCKFGL